MSLASFGVLAGLLHAPPVMAEGMTESLPVQIAAPSWWKGNCDDGRYFAATGKHSVQLGSASFHGLIACGPRPAFDKVPDLQVSFFPGAFPRPAWECTELASRWMYLAWGVNPYPATGSQVVTAYAEQKAAYNPGGPDLLAEKNGTPGLAPRPGDVISEGDLTTDGHVAVVTAVDPGVTTSGSGTIWIIQQNATTSGIDRLTDSGWTVGGGYYKVTGWLHNPGLGLPGVPAAGAVTATSATLSWAPAQSGRGPVTYTVLRDGSPAGQTAATTFQDAGLDPDRAYSYAVQATDPAGESRTSAAISVTTPLAINLLSGGGFETAGPAWQVTPDVQLVISPSGTGGVEAHDGSAFAEASTRVAGGAHAVYQQVQGVDAGPGHSYSFSIWLRTRAHQTVNACAVLWAQGGQAESGSTCIAVDSHWTLVTAPLDLTGPGHTGLQAQVVINTAGAKLDLDGAELVSAGLGDASFEGGAGAWQHTLGATLVPQVSGAGGITAHDGSGYAEATTAAAGGAGGDQGVYQAVSGIDAGPGRSYDFSIWLRSRSSAPVRACAVLSSIGAAVESGRTCGSFGPSWAALTAPLDITGPGHTGLQVEVVIETMGATLEVDGAQLLMTGLTGSGFEAGAGTWQATPGVTLAVQASGTGGLAAHGGGAFGVVTTGAANAGQGVFQEVSGVDTGPGRSYGFSVWLRSAVSQPVDACVMVRTIGGDSESGATCAAVGPRWTQLTAPLDIGKAGHTGLEVQVLTNTPNVPLAIDGASLASGSAQ